MRCAWPAGEPSLHDDRIARVRVKTQIRRGRTKYRHDGDLPRHRNVHRAAVIGDENSTATYGRGQFMQVDLADQVDRGLAALALNVFDDGRIV